MSVGWPSARRHAVIDGETQDRLARRARRRATRDSQFSRSRPTDWRPTEVRNPRGVLDDHFTPDTARDFIASLLEDGEDVEVIDLHTPPGAIAYVMCVELEPNMPKVYIKLQLGAAKVFGRSFHYSTTPIRGARTS